mgnify:CR=1 FL=1
MPVSNDDDGGSQGRCIDSFYYVRYYAKAIVGERVIEIFIGNDIELSIV